MSEDLNKRWQVVQVNPDGQVAEVWASFDSEVVAMDSTTTLNQRFYRDLESATFQWRENPDWKGGEK